MAVTTGSSWDGEEWEICNDHGFVFKRRRRWRSPDVEEVSEVELRRRRRDRRRQCLLGIRDRYRRELEQWEGLSSTLRDLTSNPFIATATASTSSAAASTSSDAAGNPHPSPSAEPPQDRAGACLREIDELLAQVEAQEAILRKLSEICDNVESACKEKEEGLAESLMELPIWRSPRSLMASLTK